MTWIACLSLLVLGADGPPPAALPAGVADAITLRDGKVLLGQVVEGDRRGPVPVVVRRAWAEANLPDRLAAWEKLEGPALKRAEAQRRERLNAWKRERPVDRSGNDRITPWIDAELARLADPAQKAKSPLMVVNLPRAEVKALTRRTKAQGRMLRLGWTLGLPDPETMAVESLTQALEDRGFAPTLETPVSIDALLPTPPETDNHWLLRRAATEYVHDPGGRLIRFEGMVLDEPAIGGAPPVVPTLNAAVSAIQGILGEGQPPDPLPARLQEQASRGRVGVSVTRMEMGPDFSSVGVEATLWVRVAGNRWMPAVVKSSTVRPDAMAADAGKPLEDDPQIKAAFGAIESLGFGQVPAGLKQRSLNMGAATQKALGEAKGRLNEELNALALPLEAPKDRPSTPPKP